MKISLQWVYEIMDVDNGWDWLFITFSLYQLISAITMIMMTELMKISGIDDPATDSDDWVQCLRWCDIDDTSDIFIIMDDSLYGLKFGVNYLMPPYCSK